MIRVSAEVKESVRRVAKEEGISFNNVIKKLIELCDGIKSSVIKINYSDFFLAYQSKNRDELIIDFTYHQNIHLAIAGQSDGCKKILAKSLDIIKESLGARELPITALPPSRKCPEKVRLYASRRIEAYKSMANNSRDNNPLKQFITLGEKEAAWIDSFKSVCVLAHSQTVRR